MFDSVLDSLFCKIDDLALDIQSGALGVRIKNDEGEFIVTCAKETGGKYNLVHNPLTDFGLEVPGFAVRTDPSKLKIGDIVVVPDGGYAFVVSSNGSGDKIKNPNVNIINAKTGRRSDLTVTQNKLFGSYGVLAVQNMFNLGNGEGGGLFNNPMLLMLLLKDDGGDNKDLLMWMLMSQNMAEGGNNMFNNPMMLWFLLKDKKKGGKGGFEDMMMMSMMMGGGGCNGMLPWLFSQGKNKTEASPTPKK